jgi:hypothetical protein
LHSLPIYLHSLSRDMWIGIGIGFVVAVALLCVLVWVSRRRYVVIGSSPAADMVAYQLGRIADSLDTISARGIVLQNLTRPVQHAPEIQPGILRSRESAQEPAANAPEAIESPVTVPPDETRPQAPTHRFSTSVLGL